MKEEIFNKFLAKKLTERIVRNIKQLYFVNESKYEVVNEAKCWTEGLKLNSFPKIRRNLNRMILSEGIDFEVDENMRGGIISFSTDVNAIQLSPNKLANWVKQKLTTFKNRLFATKKIDKAVSKYDLGGWTIGHYLDGRYTAKNGQKFGENSLCLEIVNISFPTLISIAEDVCREFQQQSVLVKDYSSHRILLVDPS